MAASLEKLRPELVVNLLAEGVKELTPIQQKSISKIKEGRNVLISGPKGSGKSTLALFSILQKVTQPEEGSPRALMISMDVDEVKGYDPLLKRYSKNMDLTVDLAHEKGNILQQRNDIFDGTEIIIGTPKRIGELYLQNGFNVKLLKLLIIDDASEMMRKGFQAQLFRIIEGNPKCQLLILTEQLTDKLTSFIDRLETAFIHIQEK